MMKKLLLALTLCVLSPRLAKAQDAKTAIGVQRVTYSRAIPKGLGAFVPHGGKNRFWGATNLKYNGQQIWVHIYDVEKTDFSESAKMSAVKYYAQDERELQISFFRNSLRYGAQKTNVDLMIISKSLRLKQISSTPFSYGRFGKKNIGGSPETVGVETLWLDSPTRKIPVFKVNLQNPNDNREASGTNMLVIFPKGLSGSSVAEGFGYGSDNSSDGNSWSSEINSGDEKGFLKIVSNHSTYYRTTESTLKWDGYTFVPTDVKTEDHVP